MEDIVVSRKLISKLISIKYVPAFNYSKLTDDINRTIFLDAYRPLKQNPRVTWLNVISQN